MLYSQHSLDAQAQEFLDPNKWSSDGTVALCDYAFSKDGSLLAYSTGRWVLQTLDRPSHLLLPEKVCGKATWRGLMLQWERPFHAVVRGCKRLT